MVDPTAEKDVLAGSERCPACGNVVFRENGEAIGRNFCWPTEVDTRQPGYHYLEGQWGYCYTLQRHVQKSERLVTAVVAPTSGATMGASKSDEDLILSVAETVWQGRPVEAEVELARRIVEAYLDVTAPAPVDRCDDCGLMRRTHPVECCPDGFQSATPAKQARHG